MCGCVCVCVFFGSVCLAGKSTAEHVCLGVPEVLSVVFQTSLLRGDPGVAQHNTWEEVAENNALQNHLGKLVKDHLLSVHKLELYKIVPNSIL